MKKLEKRILEEGVVINNEILKVGSFLNQQVDISLLKEMADEVKTLFPENITKVLTIEASGICFACSIAMKYDIPLVFAKKTKTSNVTGELATSKIYSFTHKEDYQIIVPKEYIKKDDRILIADDFLANGEALKGLINIVEQCGASVVGCVVQIEKKYQNGGNLIRSKGYKVKALATIEEINSDIIKFN